MNKEQLGQEFHKQFHCDFECIFFAPGRINLIGEHTDYNGGHVFPCSITYGTYALTRRRQDNFVKLYSMNFPQKGKIEFDLDSLEYDEKHDWANYPKGMLSFIKEKGYELSRGFDVLFYGNIPNGAGLSSSASIEMVTAILIDHLFRLNIPRIELVKIGQRVENDFIGVKSGIMDQFAIGMGKKEFGILLDCQTLNYEYAPIELKEHRIIIMNTNKRRELANSKYNERRSECEEALAHFKKVLPIRSLGELTVDQFDYYQHVLKSNTLKNRARHAVYENHRTLKALQALKGKDLKTFGQLMSESHLSLKHDYEVTGKELDALVEAAWLQDGVVGARMTGAGFGGCAIAIVEVENVSSFIERVGEKYEKEIGYSAEFYVASIGDGARDITNEVRV
ncbi:galactokinase [Heyndrickxia sporothermodurans]|nr:galactokinase [Heyndrickxia sporothermodurans]